jgi:hypothetical protein
VLKKKVCNPSPTMIKQTTRKIDCGQNTVASSNTSIIPVLMLRLSLRNVIKHNQFQSGMFVSNYSMVISALLFVLACSFSPTSVRIPV